MSSKFKSLWRIMFNYNFEVDGEVPPGVLCSICSKLLIEPYAAECGSQFCGDCIKNYLAEGARKCPDSSCDEFLKIDENVFKDVRTNHVIKTVIVKCPNKLCDLSTELEKMEDHINKCDLKLPQCPFEPFGCVNEERRMDDHFVTNAYKHGQLVSLVLDETRSDLSNLKEILMAKEVEIEKLKEENQRIRQDMNDFKEICTQEIHGIKNSFISASSNGNQFEPSLRKQNSIISGLNNDKRRSEADIVKINEDKKYEIKMGNGSSWSGSVKSESSNASPLLQMNDSIASGKVNFGPIISENQSDKSNFVWIVDNFSVAALKKPRYSEPFYRNDYKFCLCAFVTEVIGLKENQYLELYFVLMKGDHDDAVPWPMTHEMELAIINQISMTTHKSGRYSYAKHNGQKANFDRPTKEMNRELGGLSIAVKEIKCTAGILSRDTVMLMCTVSEPSK